jgi:hypothetical protein
MTDRLGSNNIKNNTNLFPILFNLNPILFPTIPANIPSTVNKPSKIGGNLKI